MDLKTIRRLLYALSYGIFGIIIAIILIRILFGIIGANKAAPFVSFWYTFSETFIGGFQGIFPNIGTSVAPMFIEVYAVIALIFYLILAFIVSKALTSVISHSPVSIFKNVTDTIFKGAEFFLITRFLLKLTAASDVSSFVRFIYQLSDFIYQPFAGILPTIQLKDFNIIFETSTLIAIVIIIIFDLVTEGVIDKLFKAMESHDYQTEKKQTGYPKFPVAQPVTPTQPTPQQYQPMTTPTQNPQHITINIPQPGQLAAQPMQQPPTYVDNRTIKVYPGAAMPQQMGQPNYPNSNENMLSQPAPLQQLPPQN
ncbi:MAG: YggT family protein [bacterium]